MIFFVKHPDLSRELSNNYTIFTELDINNVYMSPTSGNGSGNNPSGSSNNPLGSGNGGPPNPNNKPDPILDPESLDKNSKRKRPRNLLPYPEPLGYNSKRPKLNSDPIPYPRPNLNPDPLPDHESLGTKSNRRRPYYKLDFCLGKGKSIR